MGYVPFYFRLIVEHWLDVMASLPACVVRPPLFRSKWLLGRITTSVRWPSSTAASVARCFPTLLFLHYSVGPLIRKFLNKKTPTLSWGGQALPRPPPEPHSYSIPFLARNALGRGLRRVYPPHRFGWRIPSYTKPQVGNFPQ